MAARSEWDQLPDEPIDSYGRFVIFRNLGPGRTLGTAYQAFRLTFQNAIPEVNPRKTRLYVPGHWGLDSSSWNWHKRADAYDAHVFETYGERAVVKFIGALDRIADKVCRALAKSKIRPKSWRDCLEALAIIQQYAHPGSVNALIEIRKRSGDPGRDDGSDEPKREPVAIDDGVS